MQIATTLTTTSPGTISDRQAARLKESAQQFEAMMLGEVLKPLHFGQAPGAEPDEGGANETLGSYGSEALAKAISARGGFGIANRIIRQVSAQREASATKPGGTKV